jgi:hypothetical protein
MARHGLARRHAGAVGCNGSGSDFAEEPAAQGVEPVTLAYESFPSVLPGPL